MNPNIIPITERTGTAPKEQKFSITIAQNPCKNCQWATIFPPEIQIISATEVTPPNYEWVLCCDTPGTYMLHFHYKKQCCGKPLIQHEYYSITIQ